MQIGCLSFMLGSALKLPAFFVSVSGQIRRARRIYTLSAPPESGREKYQSSSLFSPGDLCPLLPTSMVFIFGGRGISTITTLIPNCSASFGSRGA